MAAAIQGVEPVPAAVPVPKELADQWYNQVAKHIKSDKALVPERLLDLSKVVVYEVRFG